MHKSILKKNQEIEKIKKLTVRRISFS